MLEMPETTNPAEAFIIAIVGRFPMEQMIALAAGKEQYALIDYFTLERPGQITPRQPSVFCGWSSDGKHLNFGPGPQPVVDEFMPFLIAHVESADTGAS